jgi:O-antigen/teichoic acid export membrane protein
MFTINVRLVSGVVVNWLAAATTMVVGFVLAPLLVSHFGEAMYGVWVLIGSTVSYMNLLDFGLRGGVMRFVARGHAQGRHADSAAAVAAALQMRLWIGCGIVTIAAALALLFPFLFDIPNSARRATQLALMLSASNLAISMMCGVFAAVLGALNRFHILSGILVVQAVARLLSALYVVRAGYSIAGLALSDFCVSMAANAATVIAARYCYPELRHASMKPDRSVMRQLWNYSFYSFVINVSTLVIVQTDNIVVGAFVSTAAVAFYGIAGSLVQYTRDFVTAMTSTFTPLASRLDAEARQDDLRRLLVNGSTAALMVALPVMSTLFFRGGTFLGLWLDHQFSEPSGAVLQVLLLGYLPRLATGTGLGIAYGTDNHRPFARWSAVEAILNLVLSILCVQWFGMIGVAWGTAIPSAMVSLFWWLPYTCRLVNISTLTYLRQAWLKPFIAAVPFTLVSIYIEGFNAPHSLLVFFMQVAMALPVFIISVAVLYWFEMIRIVRSAWTLLRPPLPS